MKLINQRRKRFRDGVLIENEEKVHYKMYKDGKQLVFAGIVSISFMGLGLFGINSTQVHADTVADASSSVATSSSASSSASSVVTLKASSSAASDDSKSSAQPASSAVSSNADTKSASASNSSSATSVASSASGDSNGSSAASESSSVASSANKNSAESSDSLASSSSAASSAVSGDSKVDTALTAASSQSGASTADVSDSTDSVAATSDAIDYTLAANQSDAADYNTTTGGHYLGTLGKPGWEHAHAFATANGGVSGNYSDYQNELLQPDSSIYVIAPDGTTSWYVQVAITVSASDYNNADYLADFKNKLSKITYGNGLTPEVGSTAFATIGTTQVIAFPIQLQSGSNPVVTAPGVNVGNGTGTVEKRVSDDKPIIWMDNEEVQQMQSALTKVLQATDIDPSLMYVDFIAGMGSMGSTTLTAENFAPISASELVEAPVSATFTVQGVDNGTITGKDANGKVTSTSVSDDDAQAVNGEAASTVEGTVDSTGSFTYTVPDGYQVIGVDEIDATGGTATAVNDYTVSDDGTSVSGTTNTALTADSTLQVIVHLAQTVSDTLWGSTNQSITYKGLPAAKQDATNTTNTANDQKIYWVAATNEATKEITYIPFSSEADANAYIADPYNAGVSEATSYDKVSYNIPAGYTVSGDDTVVDGGTDKNTDRQGTVGGTDVSRITSTTTAVNTPTDQNHTVTFAAATDETVDVSYVDDTDASDPAKVASNNTTLTGTMDANGTYTINIPSGFSVDSVSGGNATLSNDKKTVSYKFNSDDSDNFTITLVHNFDESKIIVTQKVTYVGGNGTTKPDKDSQDIIWVAEKDEVTGVSTFTPQSQYEGQNVNVPDGYTVQSITIDGKNQTDLTSIPASKYVAYNNSVNGSGDEDLIPVGQKVVVTFAPDTDTQATGTFTNTTDKDNPSKLSDWDVTLTGSTDGTASSVTQNGTDVTSGTIKIPDGYILSPTQDSSEGVLWQDNGDGTITYLGHMLTTDADNFNVNVIQKFTSSTDKEDTSLDTTRTVSVSGSKVPVKDQASTIYWVKVVDNSDNSTKYYSFENQQDSYDFADYLTDHNEVPSDMGTVGTYEAVSVDIPAGYTASEGSDLLADGTKGSSTGATDANGLTYTVAAEVASTGTAVTPQNETYTVLLTANTDTTANIGYHDNTDKKDLDASNDVTVTGTTDEVPDANNTFTVPKGYKLADTQDTTKIKVIDDYTYSYVYPLAADNTDDAVVNLVHDIQTIGPSDESYKDQTNADVSETVTYVWGNTTSTHNTGDVINTSDADAGNVKVNPVTVTKHFTRTIYKDLVTGSIIKRDPWVASDGTSTSVSFDAVDSPTIDGYTPSPTSVAELTGISPDSSQTDYAYTVTYTADTQKASITYVDDTTGETIHVDTKNGGSGTTSDYTTATEIKSLVAKGYELVNSDFPAAGLTFDTDTATDQNYTVHFKHGVDGPKVPTDPTDPNYDATHQSVNETIQYQFTDGTQAADPVNSTKNFTRTVTIDKVTGDKTFGTWTAVDGDTFDKVDSPVIAGYTPSQTSVAAQKVSANDQDINETVTYRTDTQNASITYVDDTTGDTILIDTPHGGSGTKSDYTTATEIESLVAKGYELVSSDFPSDGLTFDTDTATDQNYTVHLTHGIDGPTVPTDPKDPNYDATHQSVNETIKYQFTDGTQAAESVNSTKNFTRTVTIDEVTGEKTYGTWTAVDGDTFDKVDSPVIAGYKPSQTSVAAQTVSATDQDINETITYRIDTQNASIAYVDDITGETIHVDTPQGGSGTKSDYTTATEIESLVAKGYELVSSDFPSDGLTFDTDTATDQNYTVHLTHGIDGPKVPTDPKDPNYAATHQSVNETIKYQFADGTQAAEPVNSTKDFTRTVTIDKVTGEKTYGTWTAVDGDTFGRVDSPVIAGYTPSQSSVAAQTVSATDQDINETVTYNTDTQKASITYVDDTTGVKIKTEHISGNSGTKSDYTTASDIKDLEDQGYELVGSDFPSDGLTYDTDTATDQNYTVHLTHGIDGPKVPTDPTDPNYAATHQSVNETIKYQFADGTQAAEPVNSTKDFTRTVTIDKVTGDKTYGTWTAVDGDTFGEVDSPVIAGYTPSQSSVAAQTVSATDQDINETVTYNTDTQKASITYVDDTTGVKIKTEHISGNSGTKSDYTTATDIKNLEDQGYELVSSDFPSDGLTYDTDTATDQNYTVHLTHGIDGPTVPTDPKDPNYDATHQSVNETIKYQYTDGTQAADPVNSTKDFTRTVTIDKVTGDKTFGTWKAVDGDTFGRVDSPIIAGYTPDQTSVAAQTVTADSSDINKVIIYRAGNQNASITYVDDTTGVNIKTEHISGNSGTKSDYTTATEIKSLEDQGYELVGSDFPSDGLTYDTDASVDQNYTVHFKHSFDGPTVPTDPKDPNYDATHQSVNETIKYQFADGTQAAEPVNSTKDFTRTVTIDKVTGDKTYGTWTAVDGDTFGRVDSPVIAGYTPSQSSVAAQTVSATDQDISETITYRAGNQNASITYVDDTTGVNIKTEHISGNSGTKSDYTTATDIKDLEDQGYELVSSDFPSDGLTYDTDANVDQNYTVHFKHSFDGPTVPTDPKDPNYDATHQSVNETIKYQFADGTQAAEPVNSTKDFTRTVTIDKVTGDKTYGTWTAVDGDTFGEVDSPVIAGYTPSQSSVAAQTVSATDQDINETITYRAGYQNASITYVDDTTGAKIHVDQISGNSGTKSDYTTTTEIKDLEDQGYELVSSDFPSDGLTYDTDTATDQNYTVHLTHGIDGPKVPTDPKDPNYDATHQSVNETIKYQFADGTQAAEPVNSTKDFTRTVTIDKVTGEKTYGDWAAVDGDTFGRVDSPVIAGYTPSQTSVAAQTVSANDQDINETITYRAGNQNASITYVDDTTGVKIKIDHISGDSGTKSDYTTATEIKSLEDQGYELVSSDFPSDGLTYDSDTVTDQNYTVHLTHGIDGPKVPTDPKDPNYDATHQSVNETIKYQFVDGTQAAESVNSTKNFTRTVAIDKVTGDKTYGAWTAVDGDTFGRVDSPVIAGYTPSQSSVAAQTVSANDQDINETITYRAVSQNASITYVDDTTGVKIKIDHISGNSGTKSDYTTATEIKSLEDQGYELVSSDFPSDGLTYDTDANVDQNYTVHFKHSVDGPKVPTDPKDPNYDATHQSVNETIKYQFVDGTQAAESVNSTKNFTRTVAIDKVTGDKTYGAWTAVDGDTFGRVDSPVITGYTPSQTSVAAQTVSANDQDINETITYRAVSQNASITYVDDTTGVKIKIDHISGNSGTKSDYTTATEIKSLEDQGYELVSSDFPSDGLTYDTDANVDQNYTVHFKHSVDGPKVPTDPKDPNYDATHQSVNETIKYQFADGTQAAEPVNSTKNFTRTVAIDKVTGDKTYGAWTAVDGDTFGRVDSPVVAGYTPDQTSVAAQTVTADSSDINKIIVYRAVSQNASITYVDDTTGAKIHADHISGNSGTKSDYTTATEIKSLEDQGYELVSSDFPTDGLTYDTDTNVDQNYTVHFKHGVDGPTVPTDPKDPNYDATHQSVNETIKYQFADGTQAAEPVNSTKNFTRTVTIDKVTGDKTYGAWTAVDGDTFGRVDSPVIAGYTPSQTSVAAQTVSANDQDINETVTYRTDTQKASITYVDDTTGEIIQVDTPNGGSGTKSDYTTATEIKSLEDQGYELVSSDFPTGGLTFDTDTNVDQNYTVHFKHGVDGPTVPTDPKDPNYDETHQSVNETIKYQFADGTQAAEPVNSTKNFTRTVTIDKVTGDKTYGAWTAVDGDTFGEVDSPIIAGYTPDQTSVAAQTVTADSSDINKIIVYRAVSQNASITYVDDTTGAKIKIDHISGNSGTKSDYTTATEIKSLEDQGYELVSSDFPTDGLTYDTDANVDQNYTVHFKHGVDGPTVPTDPKDPNYDATHQSVNETIKYQFADGTQAAEPVNSTKDFTRTVTIDKVTGDKMYGAWTAVDGDTFGEVDSPIIAGYTPDQTSVAAQTVTADSSDINKIIVYRAVSQNASITYVDDTTGAKIKIDHISGNSGTKSDYTTATEIKSLEDQGYELVSSDFPTGGLTFDTDTNVDQNYTVHFKHGVDGPTVPTDPKDPNYDETHQKVTETIKYVYPNGKTAVESHVSTLNFTRTVTTDKVTGKKTYGNWVPVSGNMFPGVTSPQLDGFAPSTEYIDAIEVDATTEDITKVVTYYSNAPEQGGHQTTPPTHEQVTPPVKNNPGKPVSTKQTVAITPQKANKVAPTKQAAQNEVKKLPQTGETDENGLMSLGFVSLLMSFVGLFGIKKRRKEGKHLNKN